MTGVFIDDSGLRRLRKLYADVTGDRRGLADITYGLQKTIMAQHFRAPVRMLSRRLVRLATADRHARDLSPSALRLALVELTACLPVYRTYVDARGPSREDRAFVEHAVAAATRRNAAVSAAFPALSFLRRVVLLDTETRSARRTWLEFALRWQQFTGAVAAKGVEDTAFYRFHPLVSLNAVGADPERLTAFVGPGRFHARMVERQREWPATMNTTSTHDSKRSEDVRARVNVLSELPREWGQRLRRWRRMNAPLRTVLAGSPAPDANEELFIYQNLLGAWPLEARELPAFPGRFTQFLIKASRESKLHTSWVDPDERYETALTRFVAAILRRRRNPFLADFLRFQERIAYFGAVNSLAQLVLKATAPGVPDFYQGNEFWDFSLVDPDNRRPVDFERRRAALRASSRGAPAARASLLAALLRKWRDGRIKQLITHDVLRTLFEAGSYVPLETIGRHANHLLAFARCHGRAQVVVVVPRCLARVNPRPSRALGRVSWDDTAVLLPQRAADRWLDCLSRNPICARGAARQRALDAREVLKACPVAVLEHE